MDYNFQLLSFTASIIQVLDKGISFIWCLVPLANPIVCPLGLLLQDCCPLPTSHNSYFPQCGRLGIQAPGATALVSDDEPPSWFIDGHLAVSSHGGKHSGVPFIRC